MHGEERKSVLPMASMGVTCKPPGPIKQSITLLIFIKKDITSINTLAKFKRNEMSLAEIPKKQTLIVNYQFTTIGFTTIKTIKIYLHHQINFTLLSQSIHIRHLGTEILKKKCSINTAKWQSCHSWQTRRSMSKIRFAPKFGCPYLLLKWKIYFDGVPY